MHCDGDLGDPIRVVIIEKETNPGESLADALSHQKGVYVSGSYPDVESAPKVICDPGDFIIMIDCVPPYIDGIAFMKKLKTNNSEAKVIILSDATGEEIVMETFKAGARAYLPRDVKITELVHTIRTVHNGEVVIGTGMLVRFINYMARLRESQGACSPLCEEEKSLLVYAGMGWTDREIARRMLTNVAVIRARFKRVFKKLSARDRTNAVIRAIQVGEISLEDLGQEPPVN